VKENSDGNDTNVGSIGNSIEEDIKILEEFKTNGYSILLMKYGDRIKTNFKLAKAIENILSAYKRVLKENERYKKSDYETICLENNELREITDRIQSEYNDLLKDNFKLKNELETKRKEYQETYKDVREELKELRKENEELKNNIRKNENELEFDVNCDWIALQKMLDESEKSNEYISYKNEKWIKEKYCIPIQKIKAKIEELDIAISECIYLDEDDEKYKKAVKKDKLCLLNQKRALQELLDGSDTDVGSIGSEN
jgi:hypothetical protein